MWITANWTTIINENENLIGPFPICNIHLWRAGYVIVWVNWVRTSSLCSNPQKSYILGTESVREPPAKKNTIYKKSFNLCSSWNEHQNTELLSLWTLNVGTSHFVQNWTSNMSNITKNWTFREHQTVSHRGKHTTHKCKV